MQSIIYIWPWGRCRLYRYKSTLYKMHGAVVRWLDIIIDIQSIWQILFQSIDANYIFFSTRQRGMRGFSSRSSLVCTHEIRNCMHSFAAYIMYSNRPVSQIPLCTTRQRGMRGFSSRSSLVCTHEIRNCMHSFAAYIMYSNRPVSQIPLWTSPKTYNAPFL